MIDTAYPLAKARIYVATSPLITTVNDLIGVVTFMLLPELGFYLPIITENRTMIDIKNEYIA